MFQINLENEESHLILINLNQFSTITSKQQSLIGMMEITSNTENSSNSKVMLSVEKDLRLSV